MTARDDRAPKPDVLYLRQILRKIERGDYRIPAFQRGYVWDEQKVLRLLESVAKGYPIGSILLWKSDTKKLELADSEHLPYPVLEERYPTTYILDGLQRCGALYGAFYKNHGGADEVFAVGYDLRNEVFVNLTEGPFGPEVVPLRELFDSLAFLRRHGLLLPLDDGPALVERAVNLLNTFQEYMVATVTIEPEEVDDVVEIFERINSTGTPLNSLDFMRAVTWSPTFDLNDEISDVAAIAAGRGFELEPETAIKLLSLAMDKEPLPSSMLELRDSSPSSLHEGIRDVKRALLGTIELLESGMCLHSSDYLPYEGVLLVAFGFVLASHRSEVVDADQASLDKLMRWALSVSLSEGLRGRPDNYVARACREAKALGRGARSQLSFRLSTSVNDLTEKRFIRRKARSSAFALMLAKNGAMSLRSGEVIPKERYLQKFDSSCYQPVLSTQELASVLGRPVSSSRVFANMVLTPYGQRYDTSSLVGEFDQLALQLGQAGAEVAFDSQGIDRDAIEALRLRLPSAFIAARAKRLLKLMYVLAEQPL